MSLERVLAMMDGSASRSRPSLSSSSSSSLSPSLSSYAGFSAPSPSSSASSAFAFSSGAGSGLGQVASASSASSAHQVFNPSALQEAAARIQQRYPAANGGPRAASSGNASAVTLGTAANANHHLSTDELAYRTLRRSNSTSNAPTPTSASSASSSSSNFQSNGNSQAYGSASPSASASHFRSSTGSSSAFAAVDFSSYGNAHAPGGGSQASSGLTSATANTGSQNQLNRVRVAVRVRPPIPEDLATDVYGSFDNCARVDERNGTVCLSRATYDDREFRVDRALSPDASQEVMYNVVAEDIVDDVLKGYNGTVLAYGQTGTGKTWTMFGPSSHWEQPDISRMVTSSSGPAAVSGVSGVPASGTSAVPNSGITGPDGFKWILDSRAGVIPRAVRQIFSHIEKHMHTVEFRVTVSFLQIYMENIMDLLDAGKTNLAIREDPKQGLFVDGLTQVAVRSPADMLEVIQEGARNRAITSTNMNKVSSRSHVILMLTIEQRSRQSTGGNSATTNSSGNNNSSNPNSSHSAQGNNVKRGVLTIVDLAGSERVSKSLSEGQRLEEAKKINKSLSALGNCVAALTEPNMSYVPFRDSKLTRLLTESLGGNSKTCLCATIGPAVVNYEESHSTLLFATRAMAVRNHAVINEVVDFKTLTGSLQRQITQMQDEKSRLVARNVDLEREISRLRGEVDELRRLHSVTQTQLLPSDMLSSMDPHPHHHHHHQQQQQQQQPQPQPQQQHQIAQQMVPMTLGMPAPVQGLPPRPSSAMSTNSRASVVHNNENVAPHQNFMVEQQRPGSAQSFVSVGSVDPVWEQRERELVAKFSNIIQHLQMEIAKQNYAQVAQQQQPPPAKNIQNGVAGSNASFAHVLSSLLQSLNQQATHATAGTPRSNFHSPAFPAPSPSHSTVQLNASTIESDAVVDQLISSIVNIPVLRNRLVERLHTAEEKLAK
eukprot:ANDGO_00290.mRNA.1 Armadillo repeat-containing kinesin-like protein 3